MYFQTHFAILIAISASINAAVIARQDFSNEIVYLSNCYDAGDFSSELDYYANREESRAGQFPDSIAVTASHTNTPWDNLHFFGATFPSGVHFTITTMNGNTKPGELSGQANNGFSTFTCFREQDVPLYASGSKTCNKLFSCAHNNHVEFQETKFSFSSKMVEVVDRDVPHNGPEVFNNVFNIINQDACGNSPQPIGNGCNINFACDATNANILNAMAHFLVEDMGPSITSSTRTIPRQGSCEDPNQPMDPDFCNGYDEHVAQFPATGKINVENHFSNDPQSSSQNSQLTYEITCPAAEQTCNKNICDAALGSATAAAGIISPEIGGILGIIGPLECLICA